MGCGGGERMACTAYFSGSHHTRVLCVAIDWALIIFIYLTTGWVGGRQAGQGRMEGESEHDDLPANPRNRSGFMEA